MNRRDEIEAERRAAAEAALAGVVRDAEVVGSSGFARTATEAGRRLGARLATDVDPNDPIEIWGRRIGRGLGFLFAAYLAVHLLRTYVIG